MPSARAAALLLVALLASLAPTNAFSQGCQSAPIGSRYGVYWFGGGCGALSGGGVVDQIWFQFTRNGVPLNPFYVNIQAINNGSTLYNDFVVNGHAPGCWPAGLYNGEWGCNGCGTTQAGPPNNSMNSREFILYTDLSNVNYYRLYWAADNVPGAAVGAPGAFALIVLNTPPVPWPGGAPLHAPGPDCQVCLGPQPFSKYGTTQTETIQDEVIRPSAFFALADTGEVAEPVVTVPAVSPFSWFALALSLAMLGAVIAGRRTPRSPGPPPLDA